MAHIRNSISMTDQMTPTLRSIMKALDSTLRVMDMVNKHAGAGMNSKAFAQAERDIQRANNALIQMGNYAQLGNGAVQSSTQKSINQMNILEAAAYGAGKAINSIKHSNLGQSIGSKMSGLKNFSLADKFAQMQTRGANMMNMGGTLAGGRLQSMMGGALKTIGTMGSGIMSTLGRVGSFAGPIFSKIGSGASTAFNIAKNSVSQLATVAGQAFSSIASRSKMAWTSLASGIYVIKNIANAISNLAGVADKAISSIQKLQLQNHSDLTGSQAYTMAYKAAQASRSDIASTSNLASKIAMSGAYGQGEGSLESAINMAETINKALVVGGGTQEENSRALLQLTQGLASGVLQGDELRSIREQSPYMAQMLAEGLAKVSDEFAGVTAGDLKQLGAEGKLTSDTVIKAFEAMEDQINSTFDAHAPKTWAQGITSISNTIQWFVGVLQQIDGGPLEKIAGLVWQIADYLQSTEGLQVMSGIAAVLGVIGDVLSWIVSAALSGISWLMENMWLVYGVLIALAIMATITGATMLVSWLASVWPLLLIIAVCALIIKVFMDMGFTFGDIVGAICGGVMVIIAFFQNLGLSIWGIIQGVWAVLQGLWNNAGLAFQNVGLGIKSFFAGIMSTVLGFIAKIAEALNKLPFIEFDYAGLSSAASNWASEQAAADAAIDANKSAMTDLGAAFTDAYNSVGAFSDGWASDAYASGSSWGSGIVAGIGDSASNIFSSMSSLSAGNFAGATGGGASPVDVGGGNLDKVGSVGGIDGDVNIADEDLQLLRDIAARDYLLQLQTVTPVAHITFGDVRETADINKIVDVIEQMVEEQMATALVS